MKKIYKIILFFIWFGLGCLSYANPITDTKEMFPVILTCLWFYSTYLLESSLLLNRQFIMYARKNGELGHECLTGFYFLMLASFVFLSLAFISFSLFEHTIARWIISGFAIAVVIILSFYLVRLLPNPFRIAGILCFSLLPTISICMPFVWNNLSPNLYPIEHGCTMLIILGFSIISFSIFHLLKEDTI